MFYGRHIFTWYFVSSHFLFFHLYVVLQISVRNFRPNLSEQEGQEEMKMEIVCTIN